MKTHLSRHCVLCTQTRDSCLCVLTESQLGYAVCYNTALRSQLLHVLCVLYVSYNFVEDFIN